MATEEPVMIIEKPNFTVKLHESLLEVDLKEGARKELEDVVEAHPTLRASLGFLFQNIIPLDVPLGNIESVELDEKKQVKIRIPNRKDITIPLEPSESEKLITKLNELIPKEKQRKLRLDKALEEGVREQSIRKAHTQYQADQAESRR